MWKLSCDITMNIQKSFRKKALFSCSMACLVDLCFDLEFSFRVKKLWKADPYSQYYAKGENMLHVWGAKGLTTALLEICAGGCSKRARDWGLVSRCLFPAMEVLVLSWVLLECLRLCWNAWGWAVPAALHTLPWGAIPLCVPRMNCSESVLICTCTVSLEWLEITKGCSVLGACPGKGGSGQPCCSGHTVL